MGVAYYFNLSSSITTEGNITVTDMLGRTVIIPEDVQKIATSSPPMTALVYMLAPDKLIGLNYQWNDREKEYVNDKYINLPIIGGWYAAQEGNYEEIISIGPDIVIEGDMGDLDLSIVNERQEKFGSIPVIGVIDNSDVTNIIPSIEFMGKILPAEEKAKKLIDFTNKYLDKANTVSNSIQDSEKKRVYYVRGKEGLDTAPSGSLHTQLINIVGGKNVVDIGTDEGNVRVEVSMEQVIKWNPEVIITTDESFYNNVYNDLKWSNIKAVKDKQVYLSPQSPFKWFEKPFGANIILGILWTAKVIYPDKYSDINLKEEVRYFYKEFYHYDLTDNEVKDLLLKSGLKEENM
jgi:iron complex transport system substrate-binding protein